MSDEAVAVVEKPPRRFPPPCWTQEETLALIDTYRDRWYALRRGYLRTPDWDAVADAVGSRCPGALPTKTSAQCRHKMEKLRQRYRAEKQRSLSVPSPGGRYLSSWFFFENMEAMENGTVPPASVNSADGSRLKSFLDQSMLKLKLKAGNAADSVPESGFNHELVKLRRFDPAATIPGLYPPYLNKEEQQQQEELPQPILKSKVKKSTTTLKNQFHQSDALPPASIPKSFRKVDPDDQQQFWVKYSNLQFESGSKRGRNGVQEIVASIKALGEGFMKIEKAKMDLAREMEEMRMEREMKRNQLLLESQKQIVEAFLKGLLELKTGKKLKSGVAAAADYPSAQP